MKAAAGVKTAGPEPFPWAHVIHAGLCLLRLDPKTFWAMSPREFHAMTGGAMPKVALPLAELMARYPDDGDGVLAPCGRGRDFNILAKG
ncbi:rcc01693 family protein [Rhizobium sp. L1K21]|uniref:rcc01693 family protein n=1 Tax=Rhizobium sp. L1K21 TaxID=2954933 RepID=UPI00209381E0|nr:rcc01693 family protein [Rhizobium sp. L1K21]MCO6186686.1 phage tail assembly chaperone [Rhizobium sp. L1K21]